VADTSTPAVPTHILVVEDEEALGEILCSLLEERGHQATHVRNGVEALAALKASPEQWDLALSDIIMPQMNGIEFLQHARSLYPDLPVIMISALHDIRIAMESMRGGAYDYVVKPFERDQIYLAVDRAIERQRLLHENRKYQLHLESLVQSRTDALEETLRELERSYDFTLEALGSALDLKDSETEGHSRRVTAYTLEISRNLGLDAQALKTVARGAYLHDIGKMGVPDSILRKTGPLTEDETEAMRSHCRRGYDILAPVKSLEAAADIVLSHQERYDGSGYPRGLKGEEIPVGARIFAVADTLDAMTSDRPYRKSTSFASARAEIARGRGTQFDPKVVDVYLSIPDHVWIELRSRITEGFSLSALGWEKNLSAVS
jgi:putative nucleotidyltransferase with HDIG domain